MRTTPRILLSRRTILQGGVALSAMLLGKASATAPARLPAMTIYRDPGCGCCGNWAEMARRTGFPVTMMDSPDMPGLKRRLGVPQQLSACHTAVVGGYVIEGHVPFDRVLGLVSRRPRGIRGLAVPGMPVGSPGMEVPSGARESFQVFAFNAAGRVVALP